jgi:hypothetical protein
MKCVHCKDGWCYLAPVDARVWICRDCEKVAGLAEWVFKGYDKNKKPVYGWKQLESGS